MESRFALGLSFSYVRSCLSASWIQGQPEPGRGSCCLHPSFAPSHNQVGYGPEKPRKSHTVIGIFLRSDQKGVERLIEAIDDGITSQVQGSKGRALDALAKGFPQLPLPEIYKPDRYQNEVKLDQTMASCLHSPTLLLRGATLSLVVCYMTLLLPVAGFPAPAASPNSLLSSSNSHRSIINKRTIFDSTTGVSIGGALIVVGGLAIGLGCALIAVCGFPWGAMCARRSRIQDSEKGKEKDTNPPVASMTSVRPAPPPMPSPRTNTSPTNLTARPSEQHHMGRTFVPNTFDQWSRPAVPGQNRPTPGGDGVFMASAMHPVDDSMRYPDYREHVYRHMSRGHQPRPRNLFDRPKQVLGLRGEWPTFVWAVVQEERVEAARVECVCDVFGVVLVISGGDAASAVARTTVLMKTPSREDLERDGSHFLETGSRNDFVLKRASMSAVLATTGQESTVPRKGTTEENREGMALRKSSGYQIVDSSGGAIDTRELEPRGFILYRKSDMLRLSSNTQQWRTAGIEEARVRSEGRQEVREAIYGGCPGFGGLGAQRWVSSSVKREGLATSAKPEIIEYNTQTVLILADLRSPTPSEDMDSVTINDLAGQRVFPNHKPEHTIKKAVRRKSNSGAIYSSQDSSQRPRFLCNPDSVLSSRVLVHYQRGCTSRGRCIIDAVGRSPEQTKTVSSVVCFALQPPSAGKMKATIMATVGCAAAQGVTSIMTPPYDAPASCLHSVEGKFEILHGIDHGNVGERTVALDRGCVLNLSELWEPHPRNRHRVQLQDINM
ncbi:hypothetical protein V8F20_012104 [Naviculisporaceae sp. PSN 640]